MKNEKKTDINQKNIAHNNDELAELKELINKHGKNALTAFLVVLIGVMGAYLYTSKKAARAVEASVKMSEVKSVTDLETVVANYDGTQAAQTALIALAKQYYESGNYDAAMSKYDEFLSKYPDNELASTAQLGRIFCIEARNNATAFNEAATAYAAFAQKHPKSFLCPQAVLGEARCYEMLKDYDKARVIYEDFTTNTEDSPWLPLAEDSLKRLEHKIKMSYKAKTPETQAEVVTPPAKEVEKAAAKAEVVTAPAKEAKKTTAAKVDVVTAPAKEAEKAVAVKAETAKPQPAKVVEDAVKKTQKLKADKKESADKVEADYKKAVKKVEQEKKDAEKVVVESADASKGEAAPQKDAEKVEAPKADAGK